MRGASGKNFHNSAKRKYCARPQRASCPVALPIGVVHCECVCFLCGALLLRRYSCWLCKTAAISFTGNPKLGLTLTSTRTTKIRFNPRALHTFEGHLQTDPIYVTEPNSPTLSTSIAHGWALSSLSTATKPVLRRSSFGPTFT